MRPKPSRDQPPTVNTSDVHDQAGRFTAILAQKCRDQSSSHDSCSRLKATRVSLDRWSTLRILIATLAFKRGIKANVDANRQLVRAGDHQYESSVRDLKRQGRDLTLWLCVCRAPALDASGDPARISTSAVSARARVSA